MALGVDIVFNMLDSAALIDHKCRAEGAFKGPTVDGFFSVATIRLGDGRVRIRQQREGQLFLFSKGFNVCWPIRGDTDDLVSGAAQGIDIVPEVTCFGCASWSRSFRVEIHNNLFTDEVIE